MSDPLDDHNARMTAQAHAAWFAANPGVRMPHVSQMIQSKFLSKGDLQAPVVCTIKGVRLEQFRDGDASWILSFNELPKGLKLNNTTIRTLEAAFGPNSDAWVGQRVQVYVDPMVMMAGQQVGGIRIKTPRSAQPAGAWGQPAVPPGARFDPVTGQPLAAPAAPAARFDPMTGLPLTPGAAAVAAGAPAAPAGGTDPDFDDDIPF